MKPRFEGFYFKHHANEQSLALIPGMAEDGAFIQVVTDKNAYNIKYPLSDYVKSSVIRVGDCTFSKEGISLSIQRPELALFGELKYENLTPLRSDIMGPFRFIPMECRHGIISMRHDILGQIALNGNIIDFSNGTGYIETDSGRSFPEKYAWVQCNVHQDCSVMVSIARIPFFGLYFWGCICSIWLKGQEYRLATYKGVKILRCEPGQIELKQGKYRLNIFFDTAKGLALNAPACGKMSRVIHECISCHVSFVFKENGRIILDNSGYASCEYSM